MSRDTVVVAGSMVDTPLYEPQGYEYARSKRLGWVSDLLWWTLGKLGSLRAHIAVQHVWRFEGRTSKDTVLEAIYDAVDVVAVYHRPDEYAIVMGIADYMRLMSDNRSVPPTGFSFQAGPFGYKGTAFGIRVHVVTTLSGIAAIPRVLIERESRS